MEVRGHVKRAIGAFIVLPGSVGRTPYGGRCLASHKSRLACCCRWRPPRESEPLLRPCLPPTPRTRNGCVQHKPPRLVLPTRCTAVQGTITATFLVPRNKRCKERPALSSHLGRILIMGTTVPSAVTLATRFSIPPPPPNLASVHDSGGGVQPAPPPSYDARLCWDEGGGVGAGGGGCGCGSPRRRIFSATRSCTKPSFWGDVGMPFLLLLGFVGGALLVVGRGGGGGSGGVGG